jgi:multidrug efflux pump subunit AcrA (membrane-fusion protein)
MGGVEIADLSTQVVETDVPEGRLSLVKVGGPTEIVLDAFPQKRFRGRTIEITPQVDRAKATVLVKVKFEDDLSGVLPDMSARVSFLSEELDAEAMKEEPKTIVPDSAVVERDGAKVVFVYDEGKVRLTPVTLGPAYGRGFELEAGPIAGTKLVSDPAPTLTDGQSVKEKTDD